MLGDALDCALSDPLVGAWGGGLDDHLGRALDDAFAGVLDANVGNTLSNLLGDTLYNASDGVLEDPLVGAWEGVVAGHIREWAIVLSVDESDWYNMNVFFCDFYNAGIIINLTTCLILISTKNQKTASIFYSNLVMSTKVLSRIPSKNAFSTSQTIM